jgi:hypothetical protein
VERSDTHQFGFAKADGYRFAPPILQIIADAPEYLIVHPGRWRKVDTRSGLFRGAGKDASR